MVGVAACIIVSAVDQAPTVLIEREEPLQALATVLLRAAAGQGGLVSIGGEAGIGKSSLLREFGLRAGSRYPMHWGGCEALFTPRPLGPLQDMAHELHPRVVEHLRDGAPPEQLFPAVLQSFERAAGAAVVVFEDMHWADHATLDLVKYLGRRVPQLRLLMILTFRSDEVGPQHPLMQVLGDLPAQALTRISLQPLSPEGVASLAGAAGRSGIGLHELTSGNPFVVTECLASDDPADGVPVSVRHAVWSRLLRLPESHRKALETLSILTRAVEPWLAEALLGPASEALLEPCVEQGVLLRDGRGNLQFRHELARKATLDRLPASAQRSLHLRAEAAMARAAPDASDMLARRAHHAAAAGDAPRVLALAPAAAAEAALLGAHQQAASHLASALAYAAEATTAQAAQLHEDWAYEAGLALQIDEAVIAARHRAVELWRELGRLDKVGRNLRWLSRLHWYRGEAEQAGT